MGLLDNLNYRFDVKAFQWYRLDIRISTITEYKSGTVEILDLKRNRLIPLVRLPNIIFTKTDKVGSIHELNKFTEFSIYFKNDTKFVKIDINCRGLAIEHIIPYKVTEAEIKKNIKIFRLRRLYDLEYLDYYIKNLFTTTGQVFIDRLNGQLSLLRKPTYFDEFISKLRITDLEKCHSNDIKVLYLIHYSPKYEHVGYTIRTHQLLKNTNREGIDILGVTRYGYPFDRQKEYYEDLGVEDEDIDGVNYLNLLNGMDNVNENSLTQYLEKYIVMTIKLASATGASIIHATTNFWNGIAAVYAAKYLGIKSVYEVRGIWEDSEVTYKPEIYKSDFLIMKQKMEDFVMNKCDQVLTINDNLKTQLTNRGINGDRIQIIYNGVDTEMFNPGECYTGDLEFNLSVKNYDVVIGYIGSLLGYEGIEYIITALKILQEKHNVNAKFIMIGDGNYKDTLMELVKNLGLQNNVSYLGKVPYDDVVKYYDVFDLVLYPRKDLDVCRTTSSSKVFEAMAMKKAIIVSDLPAWREIIIDGETGLICNPDDYMDLTNKILQLVHDEELREELGRNAREWVNIHRSWKSSSDKLANIYQEMCDQVLCL